MTKLWKVLLAAVLVSSSCIAAVARFDINDFAAASPTLSGWTAVTGSADNADTLTGTDGTHTLTLTTTGDGQGRDRNVGSFSSDGSLWRDFWFVADSTIGGQTATATITGLAANTFYSVEIWAFDINSTGNRAAAWTDTVTGNTARLAFNGSTTPLPVSLADSVITLQAKTSGSGVLTLTAAGTTGGAAGLPNVFVSGIRVSAETESLPVIEAESGVLGTEFTVNDLDGATNITISPTSTSTTVPGSAARVASYSVAFPAEDVYQLYARVRVGPGGFDDDSFFHASGFGAKSPTTGSDWVFANGLAAAGFTAATDVVTAGGGTAGTQVWKWLKFATPFTVPAGSLTQTFQIGGREDGFNIDRFVFGPSGIDLTVAELESGIVAPPPDGITFDGPDGIAIHRFGVPSLGATLDGANPASGLVLIGGELQGTTLNGGLQGDGAAFRVSLDGTTFETLESFYGGSDTAHPQGGLLVSGSGFFGVSQAGGTSGTGTVFERKADGSVAVIRSFNAVAAHTGTNVGGASPSGSLAVSGSTLYGAASVGGTHGNGTLFWVASNGVNFTVLKEFSLLDSTYGTNADGAQPRGGVVLAGGKLYGTTSAGGNGGTGVVFSMDVNGSNYTVLHHFAPLDAVTAANADGGMPCGGLVISNGVIYGTTLAGGAGATGSVFALDTGGTGFITLYSFSATDPLAGTNADGASPAAGLILSGNVFYGTTSAGGGGGAGTVFALDPFVPDFRVLHSFEPVAGDGTNIHGARPVAALLRVGNALFGTAFAGGPGGSGTVFRIPIPLTSQIAAIGNPNGTVNATFIGRGAPNSNYLIQATNDLATAWQNMITQPADASGFLQFPEANLISPKRFYRIVEMP
ncbi:MAG: choice-of-anchor tandem repeat GloVer-containing protein [Verrucomicrobiota bacterium]